MGRGAEQDDQQSVTMSAVRAGLQNDYLQGLDNLRKIITNVECDIDRLKREFYSCPTNTEDAYEKYLKECNEKMLYCNSKLRKNDMTLEPVDGEVRLVSLLNKVRELPVEENFDPDILDFLTEFWEHIKTTLDSIKDIRDKFHRNAFKRLKAVCASYNNGESYCNIDLTRKYSEEVHKHNQDIMDILNKFDQLLKSFTGGVKQELFTDTSFTTRLLMSCDQKAFPILRLLPDLTEKLVQVCSISQQWIDKDETYMHDINNYIREKRSQTRKKEQDLRTQKEKQGQLTKSVDEAHDLFKNSKEKLARIETELHALEDQVTTFSETKKYKTEEKRQKEGMVGFLEISISQTKKNYTLQLKRSRLMRQLRELEESLKEIEKELAIVETTVREKSEAKHKMASQVEESASSYATLRTDLDKFRADVERLEQEVNELTDSLTSLEIIQSVKTSPEKVEDFYERPSTVKLAPSLKEKIMRKRKLKLMNSNINHHR